MLLKSLAKGCLGLALFFSVTTVTGRVYQAQSVRHDNAYPITISLQGSLQNPAFSPDGSRLLLTRFRDGYNHEPADLFIWSFDTPILKSLVSDGTGNVNMSGSAWASTGQIVFASSREPHDEIYSVDANGSPDTIQIITQRADRVAYEPTFSPDGQWVVFESHPLNVETQGILTKYRVDRTGDYQDLTPVGEDCRQPNWSSSGDAIVYQKYQQGQWDLWTIAADGTQPHQITSGHGNKTDPAFSPDGQWIVYSSDNDLQDSANLWIISRQGGTPIRLTLFEGYDGAPAWSPDGSKIAFESAPSSPDGSSGTTLWMIDIPKHLLDTAIRR